MDTEKRTEIAITITRELFTKMFDDPFALAFMTFYEVEAEEVENKVAEILEYIKDTADYLAATAPEEAEG